MDPNGALTNLQADYKASRLNDLLTIVVVQRTTAQATGNVGTQRDFNTTSGISGLAGHISTSGITNLLTAQSSSKLKGAGSTDASTTMNTNLAGRVIAVLPNGNLIVEAERLVAINNQKETMLVRGVLRPGDVRPDNSALSTVLSNLEVELKGRESCQMRPGRPILWFERSYGSLVSKIRISKIRAEIRSPGGRIARGRLFVCSHRSADRTRSRHYHRRRRSR